MLSLPISIHHQENQTKARLGSLTLPHGKVETPVFMPVGTNATVKGISHQTLEEMGYEIILANNYHLYLRPGIDVIEAAGGLHNFSGWKRNILTDSGGFQLFSLSKLREIDEKEVRFQSHLNGSRHIFTPEKVVDLQCSLGSDIQMALDFCTPPEISHEEASRAVRITTNWAKRAMAYRKKMSEEKGEYQGSLFLIIQGNFYQDLRKQSAEELLALEPAGIAIGGLSVGEESSAFKEFLASTAALLPEEKARYVMGIGTPDYILEAVENGIDLFDCVYPTRIARNGTCMTFDGVLNLRNERFRLDQSPIEEGCGCRSCQRYSRSYLRHLIMAKEMYASMLVSEHNLFFMARMMGEIRQAIAKDRFSDYKRSFLARYYE